MPASPARRVRHYANCCAVARARRAFCRATSLLLADAALSPCAAQARGAGWLDAGARRALRVLAQAPSITEGEAGRELAVFFDLHCPACLLLYRAARAAIGRGQLRVRWIPVAILGPASLDCAACLLAAPDRRLALQRAWAGRAFTPRAVGAQSGARRAVLANTQLLRAASRDDLRTPTLVGLQADGRVALVAGVSAALLARLQAPR